MSAIPSTPSYWNTPLSSPLQWITIPQMIDRWAAERPDKEAYVVRMNGPPREAVTFQQLKEKTEVLAAGLLKLGLRAEDFVMISGVNSLDWLLCDYACASIGIRIVRCRMSVLTKEGLKAITNDHKVKAIFFHPGETGEFEDHLRKCIPLAFTTPKGTKISCPDIPSLDFMIRMSRSKSDDLFCVKDLMDENADLQQVLEEKRRVHPEDVCSLFMTSGSTGFPKAIPQTHFNMLNSWLQSRFMKEFVSAEDRMFSDRSPAFIGSLCPLPIALGITIVYVHPLTNAKDNDTDFAIKVIKEEKCTCGVLLQYMLIDVVERFESGQTEPFHLQWALTGGETVQGSLVKRAAAYVGDMSIGYGTTECMPLCLTLRSDSLDKITMSAGLPEPGLELKVVDKDDNIVPMGETGEIVVRSPFAFKGYLPEGSKGMKITKEGWIYTDDAGCINAEGYVQVFGRKSQVISRGITLIYPIAVERIILQFPGVAKVAVVGVPDKRLGENVCACIIPREGVSLSKEDILRCFDESYKTDEGLGVTPAYFIFMKEFPTVNGKFDKKELQKMARSKFGL